MQNDTLYESNPSNKPYDGNTAPFRGERLFHMSFGNEVGNYGFQSCQVQNALISHYRQWESCQE